MSNLEFEHLLADLDPSRTTLEFRAAAREFCETEVRPLDKPMNDNQAFHHPLWQQFGEQGYTGINIPEEYGGLGLGYLLMLAVTDEISQASGSAGLSFIADTALFSNQIRVHGSQAQKEKYLPGIASGEKVGWLAISETEGGSDALGGMRTTARRVEGGYLLNGAKIWITNGGREVPGKFPGTKEKIPGDYGIAYALTSEDGSKKKYTAFIVEGGMEGFELGQKIHKNTMRGSETWELLFKDCFIPDANILKTPGEGAVILMKGLDYERLLLAGGALGLAVEAMRDMIDYVGQRKQFKRPVGSNQVVAYEIADMHAELQAARQMAYVTAAMADKTSRISGPTAAAVFLQASKIATRVTQRNAHYHGGNGLTPDYRAQTLADDARLYETGGGTEEIRREVIARSILPCYSAKPEPAKG